MLSLVHHETDIIKLQMFYFWNIGFLINFGVWFISSKQILTLYIILAKESKQG